MWQPLLLRRRSRLSGPPAQHGVMSDQAVPIAVIDSSTRSVRVVVRDTSDPQWTPREEGEFLHLQRGLRLYNPGFSI